MASPYPHYAWAGGHILLLLAAIRYLLSWITFKSVAYVFWYKRQFLSPSLTVLSSYTDCSGLALYSVAFAGALGSYAIVV